jgi:hypothetical protein
MNTDTDWQHLKAYGYAPGGYMNRCIGCAQIVEWVDKRACRCRPCAEAMHAARGMEARSGEPEGLDPEGATARSEGRAQEQGQGGDTK